MERFSFYGLTIAVDTTSADLLDEARRDFFFFRVNSGEVAGEFRIHACAAAPSYAELPALPATFYTPRNVCFRDGGVTYIDYFGKGLAIFDRERRRCTVSSGDPDLLHEIVYLLILSTVGDYLDGRGIHRVHALGVNHRGNGILLLLPSGGGKSTMALELLRRPDILLISEDTPLVERSGRILPFPLRIGVRPEQQTDVPARYIRTVRRMEFDPKTLIDIAYFSDRLSGPVDPTLLLVGDRNLGVNSEIIQISRTQALQALTKYMIVGLGVYQGLEFLLERGPRELLGKSRLVAARLRTALSLVSRVRAFRFVLGRDVAKNCETLLACLDEHSRTAPDG
jgi:hypothetical protein